MSLRPFMLMNLVVKFAVLFAHLLLFISRSDRIFLDIAFASCFLYCSLSMHDFVFGLVSYVNTPCILQ